MTVEHSQALPRTLAIDCGGTGLKATVLDPDGGMRGERVRVRTPYPCPPERFVATLVRLVAPLPAYDLVSVGLPGVVRGGVVRATPHYVTEAGPFTPVRPDLVAAWQGYDVAAAVGTELGRPARVVNDAEMQGYAVITGQGYEVVLTLGTGFGFAHFSDGILLPKIEVSAHPFGKRGTYDDRLGNHARRRIGNERWTRRVQKAVSTLQRTFWWDRVFLGGGNTRHLVAAPGDDVVVVPNTSGLLGGHRLWQPPSPSPDSGAAPFTGLS